jgi:serine/threonine protein kinase
MSFLLQPYLTVWYYSQILKGTVHIPKWLSPGAQDILRKILDPDPITRFGIDGIRGHDWFNQSYTPAVPFDDDDDNYIGDDNPQMPKVAYVICTSVLLFALQSHAFNFVLNGKDWTASDFFKAQWHSGQPCDQPNQCFSTHWDVLLPRFIWIFRERGESNLYFFIPYVSVCLHIPLLKISTKGSKPDPPHPTWPNLEGPDLRS